MKARDGKMVIFRSLGQESKPIKVKDLMNKLSESYPDRTIRRWLQKMVNEGLVEKVVGGRETRYQLTKNIGETEDVNYCFDKATIFV